MHTSLHEAEIIHEDLPLSSRICGARDRHDPWDMRDPRSVNAYGVGPNSRRCSPRPSASAVVGVCLAGPVTVDHVAGSPENGEHEVMAPTARGLRLMARACRRCGVCSAP